MDPISATLAVGSFLLNAKGASDSQKANNKAIKAQNEYDKEVYKFNFGEDGKGGESEARHQFNINETTAAKQNNEAQLTFREQIDQDNYTAAMAQRKSDYDAREAAYTASEADYETYAGIGGLNDQIAQHARAETLNKFNEDKRGIKYKNQQAQLAELEVRQGLTNQMRAITNQQTDATANLNLANTRNNNAYDQQFNKLAISDRKIAANSETVEKEKQLNKDLNSYKVSSALSQRNKQIDAFALTRDRAALASNQAQAEADDAYGDATLLKEQNVDSITAKFKRANQGLDQADSRIDQQFIEQQTANAQRKDALNAEYDTQVLEASFADSKAKLSFTENDLGETQQQSNIADTLGDQELTKNQNLASLTDEQKYQIFEVEGNLESLQGTLNKDGNFVGGDLNSLKYRYEAESAVRAFEVEAKMFEGLSAEGSVLARGQRGKSATRNVATVMASIGRQQAQLVDSILRAEKTYGSQKQSLDDQIARGNKLIQMYGTTLTRKTSDVKDTFSRQTLDKTRLINQSTARATNIQTRYGEELRFSTEGLADKLKNRDRMRSDVDEIASDQEARKTLEKGFNQEDRTLNTEEKIREIGDQGENLVRAELDKNRAKDNAADTYNLANRAFNEAEGYAKAEYVNTVKQLGTQEQIMLNSLNNQLKQYGIDIEGNANQRTAALENFKTSQTAAQNVYDSSERDLGLRTKEIEQKQTNAYTNQVIRYNSYLDSITSAENRKTSVETRIALDEYSANLTADKNRLVKPQKSPAPPEPIKYPRTIFQDPRKPGTPPKPVEGAMQSGAVFQAIGSGLGRLAQMDFSGPNLDLN